MILFFSLFRHIEEDLNKIKLPDEKTIEEMTEDEKNYLYFKIHDLDGNGKLDGLEIYYSATHHSDLPHEGAPLKTNLDNSIDEREDNFNHIIGKFFWLEFCIQSV